MHLDKSVTASPTMQDAAVRTGSCRPDCPRFWWILLRVLLVQIVLVVLARSSTSGVRCALREARSQSRLAAPLRSALRSCSEIDLRCAEIRVGSWDEMAEHGFTRLQFGRWVCNGDLISGLCSTGRAASWKLQRPRL